MAGILDRAQADILALGQARAQGRLRPFADIFRENCGGIDELALRGGITGLETGFRDLDRITRGLQPADLVIVGARPSMGKTALSLDIARHAAVRGGKTVAIFSLEMSAWALELRLVFAEADVDGHALQLGYGRREDWAQVTAALGRLADASDRLFIHDGAGMTVLEIRAESRRLQAERGLDLVIVDYLQLMSGRDREESRVQEVSAISRGLKGLAKELRVPVVALSQLNRKPEEGARRPRLSDLRESGQIEADADVVFLLFREELLNPTDKNRGNAEVIVAKQRNGPVDTIHLAFVSKFSSFRNLAKESREEV